MIFQMLTLVCLAGAVGGVVNALLTDNGFIMPRWEMVDTVRIFRPGVLGNILVGLVAAAISRGLYGPLSAVPVVGATEGGIARGGSLTLAGLVGAVLVGIAGARWLTNEVDKNLLKAAASKAAGGHAAPAAAARILMASPAQALEIAKAL
jgi:hypothetical protein